jgi:uncharacterized protein
VTSRSQSPFGVGVVHAPVHAPRIFEVPTPRGDVFAFIDATTTQPHHLLLGSGPRHLALLGELCDEADATADLIPDVVIAAEHGCTVATFDRDFARFPSVPHKLLAWL